MKVALTGSSGRVGRAIFAALTRAGHGIVGVDKVPFSTTHYVGDCCNPEVMKRVLEGADAVIHTAGPHAPHVGINSDAEFQQINVEATGQLFELAAAAGAKRFIYTSTTALYGDAVTEGRCAWIDEQTQPMPRTIYHRTKLEAEKLLESAAGANVLVRVLRMSRCFPEPAPVMAVYRHHRGIDVRDVASGHVLALKAEGPTFDRFILSGPTPFMPADCEQLASDAEPILKERMPELAAEFASRGWTCPSRIDRVYLSRRAQDKLGWQPQFGWREVLVQLDRESLEVLPAHAAAKDRAE